MAERPVFRAVEELPYVAKEAIEFQYYSGFSVQQKQRSIQSLHESYLASFPGSRILEISSKSREMTGVRLSAFHLSVHMKNGKNYSVEQLFQSAKTFEHGGPYMDLREKSPRDAKKDSRLFESGKLIRFELGELTFETEPKTYFYNWLYINALAKDHELSKAVLQYDAFTDIEFNPQRSINCQAEAAAVYKGLFLAGKLAEALRDKESFREVVYGRSEEEGSETYEQMSFIDMMK